MPEVPGSQKVFYGWFVVAACFAVTMTLGETFWSFGVFFKPLENEFGWSRALISSGYTAFLLGYSVSVIASGRLADRYSPGPILLVSAVLAGLGISLCSQVQDINELRVFLFFGGMGAGATWSVPASVVQRWFYGKQRAGLALSLVAAGVGVGALIFAPLINFLILTWGWRNAYLVVGILYCSIVALSSAVIRQSPALPKGAVAPTGGRSGPKDIRDSSTVKPWLAPSFMGITLSASFAVLAFQVMSTHLIPLATDTGISQTSSAAALGLMGGFSVIGRIMSGITADRIGWQTTLVLSLTGMALSVVWFLFLRAEWMLYIFVFVFGLCWGGRSPAWAGILGEFFGMGSLGGLIGISSAIAQVIGAFAPYLAGFIFDATGSYVMALLIVLLFLVGGCLIALKIKR